MKDKEIREIVFVILINAWMIALVFSVNFFQRLASFLILLWTIYNLWKVDEWDT